MNNTPDTKAPRPVVFSSMLKPVGSNCNLDCAYCYYLDKANIYHHAQPVMGEELLEKYIRQYIEANEVPRIEFCWHGGEPLLAGLDFYRRAVELQKKYGGNREIINSLQTNGTLITNEWCTFFRDNNFLIGISIDGPKDIHDAYRINKGREPTWKKVIQAVKMLKHKGVDFNTLSVVNNLSEGRGAEIYTFMKSIGSHYMQFMPALEYVADTDYKNRPVIVPPGTPGSHPAPWGISAEGFGRFLVDVFNQWLIRDVGTYYVQHFDASLAKWAGENPGICTFKETCGEALVVEHNGDVYSCDHFVYPGHRLGNIAETGLKHLFNSDKQYYFGLEKKISLPGECRRCNYYFVCTGQCPKHRFEKSSDGEDGMNALCRGYKMFFEHAAPYMEYMVRMLRENKAPSSVMAWAREQ